MLLDGKTRIVIKTGSSTVVDANAAAIYSDRLGSIAQDIVWLSRQGNTKIILMSSGALSGPVMNPYPGTRLGVVEEGAAADLLLVDGNPLEDLSVIGAVEKWFDAPAQGWSRYDPYHHERWRNL